MVEYPERQPFLLDDKRDNSANLLGIVDKAFAVWNSASGTMLYSARRAMDYSRVVSRAVQELGGTNKASRRADIPTTTLHYIIHGVTEHPRIDVFEKLAKALDKTLAQLFAEEGE